MKKYSILILALISSIIFVSCDDDTNAQKPKPGPSGASKTIKANEFVFSIMDTYYLYNEGISDDKGYPIIDYTKETDTEEYFEKLKDERDIFSFITDDAEEYNKEESGIMTDMGWKVTLMYGDSEKKSVMAAVNYVYEGTPAYEAGVRRGDYVVKINGQQMTPSNYRDVWNKDGQYTLYRFDAEEKREIITCDLKSREINTSPIAEAHIFTLDDGMKVGYLLYMDFKDKFNEELLDVFETFNTEGVSKLILDLRYNPGGAMLACSQLTSLIAPIDVVKSKKQIIHYQYNDNLQKELGVDESTFVNNSEVLGANLNLKDIVIIQGSGTYSASEATIIGLKPYMNVYTIGSTSGGKNTAMFILTPDMFENRLGEPIFDKSINNWLIAPLVAFYYNSENYTFDTTDGDGMDPDYAYNEFDDLYRAPLGKPEEKLTSLALEYIKNGQIAANKSARIAPFGKVIPAEKYCKIEPLKAEPRVDFFK